jgi:monoamine oxidase
MGKFVRKDLGITRRTLIGGAAVVASRIAVAADDPKNVELHPEKVKQVIVVGAGMAGLYAAWRLVIDSKTLAPSDVCVMEMSDRIGGRLDSFTFSGGPTVELGGMRFNTQQARVTKLVNDLSLKCLSFPESDNRLYYLRNTRIWQNEMDYPGRLPYGLRAAEQNMTPDDLLSYAVGNAIGNPQSWQTWNPKQWQDFVEGHTYSSPKSNAPIVYSKANYRDVGFWNLLRDQLSNEGYRYVTEGGGYDSNTINWNSAIAMPYVASGDYAPEAKYLRIEGGYHKLPEALKKSLSDANVSVSLNTRLLRFANDDNGMIDCTFDCSGQLKHFRCHYLLLCIPPRSLELLDVDGDFLAQIRRKRYFDSVIRQPSFKLLFRYKDRWYRDVQIRGQRIRPFGPTITDLPLRMIWYFDPDPSDTYWALLTCYCDMNNVQFWAEMEGPIQPGYPAFREPTDEMIEMARSQLQSVHGISIPPPKDAVFQDWGQDPFGGGYHAWAAHWSPWDMFSRMLQPIDSYNVFICGEAYSVDQGWVEGALSTVEECLLRLGGPKVKAYTAGPSGRSSSMGLRRV